MGQTYRDDVKFTLRESFQKNWSFFGGKYDLYMAIIHNYSQMNWKKDPFLRSMERVGRELVTPFDDTFSWFLTFQRGLLLSCERKGFPIKIYCFQYILKLDHRARFEAFSGHLLFEENLLFVFLQIFLRSLQALSITENDVFFL